MKNVFILFIFIVFIFSGCDYLVDYKFFVENSTQEKITLKFVNDPYSQMHDENKTKEVILLPNEEKVIRIVTGELNSPAHDCLSDHGIAFFYDLVFDTYINGEKLEKQLWKAENWSYHKNGKRTTVDYKMTITNEMIEK